MPPRQEIDVSLELTDSQLVILESHSILNLLNILIGEFTLLGDMADAPDRGEAAVRECLAVAWRIARQERTDFEAASVEAFSAQLDAIASDLRLTAPDDKARDEALANIATLLAVYRLRMAELRDREADPDRWILHPAGLLRDNVAGFLDAVAQNSKGNYRIVTDAPEDDTTAEDCYRADVRVAGTAGPEGEGLRMPPVFQDIFRDLLANARKYTNPGGRLYGRLVDDGAGLTLEVADDGLGIPADQVGRVLEFGYRATNVRHRLSMGAGFGLTKAYFFTKKYGGRFWIASAEGEGTRIEIRIPRPSAWSVPA